MSEASISAMRLFGSGETALGHYWLERSEKSELVHVEAGRNGGGVWTRSLCGLMVNFITLWRAVDHEGEVLESFVSKRRNRVAALKFLRKAMKRYGVPEAVVTDHLRSYRATMNVIGNPTARRQVVG